MFVKYQMDVYHPLKTLDSILLVEQLQSAIMSYRGLKRKRLTFITIFTTGKANEINFSPRSKDNFKMRLIADSDS